MIRDGAAGAARSLCGGSRCRLHSLRTSTSSFCTPPLSLGFLPLSLSTTTAKVRATLYSSRPVRRMASPMRTRGGCAVAVERASITAAGDVDDAVADDADFGASTLVGSPKACASASLIARCDGGFGCLRLRFLLRRRVLILRWRDGVLDG